MTPGGFDAVAPVLQLKKQAILPLSLRNNNGFTLLELLMTFVVLGIVTSIAVPAFSRWLPKYRLKEAVNDVYADMQLTRIGAIKANAEWAIVFDAAASPGRYFICSNNGANGVWDGPAVMGGDDTIEKTVNLSKYKSGVDFGNGSATSPFGGLPFGDGVTFDGDTAVFTAGGMVGGTTDGYVYLQNANNSAYVVGALANGFILMKRWNGAEWQ
jgi:type IV fimbrial biogenesis protein FimT